MVQQPGRGARPYLVAVIVAVVLIAGLRYVTQHGLPSVGKGTAAAGRRCSGPGEALTVVASSEKAQLVKQLAGAYLGTGPKVAGRCVQVNVVSKASGAAMSALARGWDASLDGPRPDVWTPASAGWVTLLQQRSARTDHPNLVPASVPHVAASPLVIAMPKPMAQALGWPSKQLGWADLLALAKDHAGWARYGHPEWGPFRLGKTNPNFSTSGLNATIAAYFAATGRSTDLTERDVADPKVRGFVSGVEQSVVHYSDTTLTFLANLQRADDAGAAMGYISAVTVEEKSVWDYNQGNPSGDPATLGKHAKPKVPLVAIYPKEGTLLSDHPWVVLSAPWVDDAKRQAAADFVRYLQSGKGQRAFTEHAFRDYKDAPGPLITAANGLDPRQPSLVIKPPAPPVLDRVLSSWGQVRKRANVLLVIDVSGSMEEQVSGTDKSKLELAKQAAVGSLAQFADDDRVGLWEFSSALDGDRDWLELVPMGSMREPLGGTTRRNLLRQRIDGLQPGGGTGLYDTAAQALAFVRGHAAPGTINAVVLLTDGRNEKNGGLNLDNLLKQLVAEPGDQSGRLFTIAYGGDADLGTLRRMAQATNGAGYDSSDPNSIQQVFTAVVSNF